MKRKEAQWKLDYQKKLTGMNLKELVAEVIDRAVPDDYDGCHTDKGGFMAFVAQEYMDANFDTLAREYIGNQ